jgi:hypothetical protein
MPTRARSTTPACPPACPSTTFPHAVPPYPFHFHSLTVNPQPSDCAFPRRLFNPRVLARADSPGNLDSNAVHTGNSESLSFKRTAAALADCPEAPSPVGDASPSRRINSSTECSALSKISDAGIACSCPWCVQLYLSALLTGPFLFQFMARWSPTHHGLFLPVRSRRRPYLWLTSLPLFSPPPPMDDTLPYRPCSFPPSCVPPIRGTSRLCVSKYRTTRDGTKASSRLSSPCIVRSDSDSKAVARDKAPKWTPMESKDAKKCQVSYSWCIIPTDVSIS